MSGLRDLASWALGGQPPEGGEEQQEEAPAETGPQLSMEEVRAQRLARMEAQQKAAKEAQKEAGNSAADAADEPEPMDTSEDNDVKMAPPAPPEQPEPKPPAVSSPVLQSAKKKNKTEEGKQYKGDAASRKAQRKKELLIKKVLQVTLKDGLVSGDASTIEVEGKPEDISTQSITEVLVNRLGGTFSPQQSLIAYLGQCHRRACEESKNLQQQSKSKTPELEDILSEIQTQVVNYASSCLIMADEMFDAAAEAPKQLAQCLVQAAADPANSITFGVTGGTSTSFYYLLCEELGENLNDVIAAVVPKLVQDSLAKCSSVLEGTAEGSAVVLVSALTAACAHKGAAAAMTQLPGFLLPADGTPEAAQTVRPTLAPGQNIMQQILMPRPYRKRSGQGLEKDTLLGVVFRIGTPMRANPGFTPSQVLRQSQDSVTRTNRSQRQQLRVYQDATHELIKKLVTANGDARNQVMKWFTDALLVNEGASAMNPDLSKVSSPSLLLNMSVSLLKLCEPFVKKTSKHSLIDPAFVSAKDDNGGIFPTTGDFAVKRLGEITEDSNVPNYAPHNRFIPQCFFLCARSLHFGICPQLRFYENVLRHINHAAWELRAAGRDMQSDPQFASLVSRQRSLDVALFQDEIVVDTIAFGNLMALQLVQMDDDEVLKTMPEDFVNDVCEILLAVAKFQGSLLRGVNCSAVFKMVVKFLSARYATMIRNYNLRARLGDVLFELYLPPASGERRDIPESVYAAPGGQTFLLSDPAARETLAPSLLLLYGEVEHTGHYDKMSHRAKIASLIKYLWESSEHRPAFRRITQNKESFIKFANGIMNETNTLIATVMQKLPEIRNAQEQMKNAQEWGQLTEEAQGEVTSRLEDNEREVKHALPLCNKTVQMFGYLNTDPDIRNLFLLEELCQRLVNMLLHVLTKLVGTRGLELKVDNPENYEFRPKEMLRDLCAIFALFATSETFQVECARAGCEPSLLQSALRTCRRLNLLKGESVAALESLPDSVEAALNRVQADEALTEGAPDEFLDEILSSFMKDPVKLPSGHTVDRATITQHLLNDPIDPFSREPMTIDDIQPDVELKARMQAWLDEKRARQT